MAAEWAVTEEALEAMQAAASGMDETTEQLKRDIALLESAFEENEAGLGAHSADIRNLLEELKAIGTDAEAPVKRLILKMMKSILIRRQHIEENNYNQSKNR